MSAPISEREIKEVNFSLFSPDEIREKSGVPITVYKLDIGDRKDESLQSLYSPVMGPSQNHVRCSRCTLSTPDCTGHFGYIEFPKRRNGSKVLILHEGFFSTIVSILRSVCTECGTPLLNENELKRRGLLRYKGEKRLKAIAEVSVKIDRCSAVDGAAVCVHSNNVFVTKEKGNYIRYHAKNEKVAIDNMPMMSPEAIRKVLHLFGMSPKNLELLGFDPNIKPEYMVLENILVLPPSARPPRVIGDKVTHNDLTHLYAEIVRTCSLITEGQTADGEEASIKLLYSLVSYLFNNSKGKYHYKNGRPHRTIKCLLTGKGRLIRGYTQGKRVNFCIRSVASPNPNLRLNQVGVPAELARIVTYPERVDETNITRLQRYVDEGKVNYITKARGDFRDKVLTVAAMGPKSIGAKQLELGDVVDRWLMGPRTEDGIDIPGDVGLVNRQPTLHKMSMMGMEIVIVPENTIQMPVNVAAPFGLDFDGDELNIHIAQTPEAAREVRGRMFVNDCIVSAQHNRPVVGLTQDSMTASFLMTKKGVFVDRAHAQQIAYAAGLSDKLPSLLERVARYRLKDPRHSMELQRQSVTEVRLKDLDETERLLAMDPETKYYPSKSEIESRRRRLDRLNAQVRSTIQNRQHRDSFIKEQRLSAQDIGIFRGVARNPVRLGELEQQHTQWLQKRFQADAKLNAEDLTLLTDWDRLEQERRGAELARRDEERALRSLIVDEEEDGQTKEDAANDLQVIGTEREDAKKAEQIAFRRHSALESQFQDWLERDINVGDQEQKSITRALIEAEVEEEYYLTGREMYSLLFPANYFYSKKNGADEIEPVVRIQEGILVEGTVDKQIVGATANSVVHDLYKMYSPEDAEDFISRAKWLTDPWLKMQGFTVSLQDCISVDPDFASIIDNNIQAARVDVWRLGPRSSNPLEEMRRQEVMRDVLCSVKNTANKLALDSIDPANTISSMVTSGSKGSKANFGSIITLVGAQEYQGRPIPPLPGGKTLPCYERNTREPAAAGFVSSSYKKGMTPGEVFLHQMASREGLLGTATKTAETGYMQRRIVKTLEDAVAHPDGTVRNSAGNIIQYAYGEDGFAGEHLVLNEGKSRFLNINRLVTMVKSLRKANLAPAFKPYEPSGLVYKMPSFKDEPVAEEDDEEEEKEEGAEEEPDADEAEDASDISEGEADDGGEDY
jgi:DNA-directed RNA polymerase beta' subunit